MDAFYSEIPAGAFYKAYVQKFWILNNHSNPFYTPPKYALPNGCCTTAFITGDGAILNFADKQVDLTAGIYLSGQITERVGISLKPNSKAIMAQLKPWAPLLITDVPMGELVNDAVSLELINKDLYQHCINLDLSNEYALIPQFYKALNPYLNATADCYFVQWAFNQLQRRELASESIAAMVASSGYTQRRVEQKFKTLIGPAAKQMQHLLQLRKLIDVMDKLDHKSQLSTLAYQHGYYDQSHFIRSYQRVIAETPSRFNSADYILPITGHFDFLQS